MQDKPRLHSQTTVNFSYLSSLPPSTLGYAYWEFLHSHSYSPDERSPVRFISDPNLSYVLQRYRETHDLWHLLTGLRTDVTGEVTQKLFEFIQTGIPMTAISAAIGPIAIAMHPQQHQQQQHQRGTHIEVNSSGAGSSSTGVGVTDLYKWAWNAGHKADFLLAVEWEKEWETSLDELRRKYRIDKAPHY